MHHHEHRPASATADRVPIPPSVQQHDSTSTMPAGAASAASSPINRRSLVVSAVASVIATASSQSIASPPTAAAAPEPDPIFMLIERHRERYKRFELAVHDVSEAEERVPRHLRRQPRALIGYWSDQVPIAFERRTSSEGLQVVWADGDGPKRPRYARSIEDIEERANRLELPADQWDAWVARRTRSLERDRRSIKRAETDAGVLAAKESWEFALNSQADTAWELAGTVPETLEGLAAMLRYERECRDTGNSLLDGYDSDVAALFFSSVEYAVCAFAMLPAPDEPKRLRDADAAWPKIGQLAEF